MISAFFASSVIVILETGFVFRSSRKVDTIDLCVFLHVDHFHSYKLTPFNRQFQIFVDYTIKYNY